MDLRWAKHAYLQDFPLIGHALANELPELKLWVTGLGRGVRLNLILKKAFSRFWVWERFRSRFPFRNLKVAQDKASQINLIINFNKYGKRLGGEVGKRYCYLS